ncbi:MAG: lipoyl synthase [Candidatus Omnitrophica bacterium]|nr:lipoyl synthase [Candidatus Omnitrophota bacterium]
MSLHPINEDRFDSGLTRLPSWFRQEIPDAQKIQSLKQMFRSAKLHTVCESAHCPNLGKCWGQGVATFMILGEVCTRACRFCAVKAGLPQKLDANEPFEVAQAVKDLKLRYVVITSVARDDLQDEGAGHFAETIHETRRLSPGIKIEVLIPDFSAKYESLKTLTDSVPEVVSHNIETVRRLSNSIRPQAQHDRSLQVLRMIRQLNKNIIVKSSFMVGLGETDEEIAQLMQELAQTGCQILTIGQYLAPSQMKRHVPVRRFVTPEQFDRYRDQAMAMGFKYVMSAPLVRSSYIAEEGYNGCMQAMALR